MSPKKAKSGITPEKPQIGTLIDTSVPADTNDLLGLHNLPNPFGDPSEVIDNVSHSISPIQGQTRIAVRTEEEQQAAAKERARQESLAHKDVRRNPLGM